MKYSMISTLAYFSLTPPVALADPSFECSVNNSSQVEIGDCVVQVKANVNAVLDATMKFAHDTAKSLDETTGRESAVPALVASQKAWKAYVDAQCKFVGASFGGGSGTGIGVDSCHIELGRQRIKELMAFTQ